MFFPGIWTEIIGKAPNAPETYIWHYMQWIGVELSKGVFFSSFGGTWRLQQPRPGSIMQCEDSTELSMCSLHEQLLLHCREVWWLGLQIYNNCLLLWTTKFYTFRGVFRNVETGAQPLARKGHPEIFWIAMPSSGHVKIRTEYLEATLGLVTNIWRSVLPPLLIFSLVNTAIITVGPVLIA